MCGGGEREGQGDDEEVLKKSTKRVEERDGRKRETLHIWAK